MQNRVLSLLKDRWLRSLKDGEEHVGTTHSELKHALGDHRRGYSRELKGALDELCRTHRVSREAGSRYRYRVTQADSEEHMRPLADTYNALDNRVGLAFERHGFEHVQTSYDNDTNRVNVSFPAADLRDLLRWLESRTR